MEILQTILAIVIPILLTAILSALAWSSHRWRKQQEAAQDKKRAEDLTGWDKVLDSLKTALFGLVTIAEREFGDKTGKLRLSWVMGEAMRLIPEKYRTVLSEAELRDYIEDALAAAKLAWDENTALLDVELGPFMEDFIAATVQKTMSGMRVPNASENNNTIVTVDLSVFGGGPMLEADAPLGEAVEVQPPDGYHWEIGDKGGVVTVADEPTGEEALDEPAEEDDAEGAQPEPAPEDTTPTA